MSPRIAPAVKIRPKGPKMRSRIPAERSRPGANHLDESGAARMVDVGAKPVTRREALARGVVLMSERARRAISAGDLKKGDALAAARIAGIMAAKRVGDLIPLCHPLPLESVEVRLKPVKGGLEVEAAVKTSAKTGVEMEAMTAVSAAALTLYDMAKSLDRGMTIGPIYLVSKSGGRSGRYERA